MIFFSKVVIWVIRGSLSLSKIDSRYNFFGLEYNARNEQFYAEKNIMSNWKWNLEIVNVKSDVLDEMKVFDKKFDIFFAHIIVSLDIIF